MRQKAEHHLEYLQDRVDRRTASTTHIAGIQGSPAPSAFVRPGPNGAARAEGHLNGIEEDEDAAGEDEDGEIDMDGLQQINESSESPSTSCSIGTD
jgi:transcriptional activator SPT7